MVTDLFPGIGGLLRDARSHMIQVSADWQAVIIGLLGFRVLGLGLGFRVKV
jgi:hypothetical protein